MGPAQHLGTSRLELLDAVRGCVWQTWSSLEPALADLDDLDDLVRLRGRDADQMLGALVRLAARDGADDDLATLAVCHQLAGLARGVAISLRDLSADIDALVAGALWIEVKTFPSRRRSRGFATSLARSTKASVLRLLKPTRHRAGGEREVPVDPAILLPWGDCVGPARPTNPAETARQDLLHLLTWARATGHLSDDDIRLLLDLVDAGSVEPDEDVIQVRRGPCSLVAVQRVADSRGVSGKTIIRRRDRAVRTLRALADTYHAEVA